MSITVSPTLNTPLQSDFGERIDKSEMTTGSKAIAGKKDAELWCVTQRTQWEKAFKSVLP